MAPLGKAPPVSATTPPPGALTYPQYHDPLVDQSFLQSSGAAHSTVGRSFFIQLGVGHPKCFPIIVVGVLLGVSVAQWVGCKCRAGPDPVSGIRSPEFANNSRGGQAGSHAGATVR